MTGHGTTAVTGGTGASRSLDPQSKVKLQKVVREFESLLVGYMLKSMKEGVPKSELDSEGFGNGVLDEMADGQFANSMTQNRSFGLADMLYKKITGESLPSQSAVQAAGSTAPAVRHTVMPASGHRVMHGMMNKPVSAPVVKATAAKTVAEKTVAAKTASTGNSDLSKRIGDFEEIIQQASAQHGVDSSLIKAVIAVESGGVGKARSGKAAKGLMQLTDSTAAAMGVRNSWDPKQNILGGTKYLSSLLDKFGGDLDQALASYNAGPGAVEKYQGIPPYRETKNYIERVKNYLQYFQTQEGAVHEEE
jgi:soluble lytic murein transglycosylase-like protein